MIKLLILFCLLLSNVSFAQYSFRTSLGIDFNSTSSLNNYINQNFAPSNSLLRSINSTVNFSFEVDKTINKTFDIGLELAYKIYSYNYRFNLGLYDLSSQNFMPSVLAYYVLRGNGYEFKFGGGVGLRFLNVDEQFPGTPNSIAYSSTGVGFLMRALGNTKLGEKLFATISADIRYDINDNVKNNNMSLFNPAKNEDVSFNSFSLGLSLGVTYLIGVK